MQSGAFWRRIGGETMSMTRKVTHNRGATVAKQVYSLSGGGELMVLPQGSKFTSGVAG